MTVIGGKAGGGLESTDVVLVLYTNDRLHSLAVLLRQRELPRHAEGPRKVGFRDDRKHNLTVTNAILHALWALVRRIDFEPTALAVRRELLKELVSHQLRLGAGGGVREASNTNSIIGCMPMIVCQLFGKFHLG